MRLLGPESRDRARGHPVQRADSRLKRIPSHPSTAGPRHSAHSPPASLAPTAAPQLRFPEEKETKH